MAQQEEVKLPEGWVNTPLDEIAKWGAGGTPKRSESFYYGGDIPWVKTGDLGPKRIKEASEHITELGVKNSSAKLFTKGSVAIAMYGATIGKTSILDFDATTNQACAVGQPIVNVTDTEFLYYLLKNEKQNFIDKGKGGAQPNISQQIIKAHTIGFPPLPEQKRIVEKLDSLLAQVDTIQHRLNNLPNIIKRFRQSVLAAAVSGKLTEQWRGKYKEYNATIELDNLSVMRSKIYSKIGKKERPLKTQPNNTELLEIPSTWSYSSIAPFLEIERAGMKTGPFGTLLKKHEHVEEGVPVLGIENIREGEFSLGSKIHITPQKSKELEAYDINFGDLIISRSGSVGDICVVPKGLGECRFSTNIMRLSLLDESMNPHYFCHLFLGSPIVLKQVAELCKGSTRLFLNQKILSSIMYPIPPIEEQTEIVRLVEQYFALADTLEKNLANAKQRVDNLTQSILAKAFKGELVPQDPNDEPAEKLLERIKAAREEADKLEEAAKKAAKTKKK